MAKLIIGILIVFAGILVVLLLFIVFLTIALLAFSKRNKKGEPVGELQGEG
jgi:cbb3-type cytochrome oxidase subunit 3